MDHKPESIRPGKTTHSGYQAQNDTRAYLSLAVLFAVLLVAVIIFGRETVISMKGGNVVRGVASAPWVGLKNYEELFSSFVFSNLLRNTIVFNLLFAVMSFTWTALLGYLLVSLPKVLKGVLAAFFGLLLFLPAEVYAGWILHLVGSKLIINAAAMRFFHPLICSVKYLGIPLMLVYLRDEIYLDKDSLAPIKAGGLFTAVSLIFISSSFFTLSNALSNSLNYETMDTLDTFAYRKGLLETNAGLSAAVGVLQILITIVSAAILFVPVSTLFRRTFDGERKDLSGDNIASRIISSAAALILFATIFFLPYLFRGYTFDLSKVSQKINLITPIFNFILVSAISAVIAAVLAAGMSKAFLSTNRKIKVTAGILLTLITVFAISPYRYSSYLVVRSFGLFNTVYAIIALTGFSSAAVWAMVCMQRDSRSITSHSFFLTCSAVFLLQTALVYGNSALQAVFLVQPNASPLLILQQLLISVQRLDPGTADKALYNGIFSMYGFLASLPPLLLFLATYIFLPKDKLLAIISAGAKN